MVFLPTFYQLVQAMLNKGMMGWPKIINKWVIRSPYPASCSVHVALSPIMYGQQHLLPINQIVHGYIPYHLAL